MRTDSLTDLIADPGPFASAYVEVSQDQAQGDRIAELSSRDVLDELSAQGAPDAVLGLVRDRLEQPTGEPAPISRCVVASERGVLLDRLVRRHRPHPEVAWGRLPQITGLACDLSGGVGFVLCLVDHEGADVSAYAPDGAGMGTDRTVGQASEFEQKVRGGGWSHARWQRSAENVWRQNARDAATEVERQVRACGAELVVIAGDERSRGQVAEALPELLAEVEVLDRAGRAADGGDEALAGAVEEVLWQHAVARRMARAHEFAQRQGQGRAVASGVDQVADAFVLGQVECLLLDAGALDGADLVTAAHPGFQLGAIDPAGTLPAGPALVAAAVATNAEIEFVGPYSLAGSPVGALLRWDSAAPSDEG